MQDRLKRNSHLLPLQIAGSETDHSMAVQQLLHTAAASLHSFSLKKRICFWVCYTMREWTAEQAFGQLSESCSCSLTRCICLCTGDVPFAENTASGKAWLAVMPLGQPSDREHATALDCVMSDTIASGNEAAARSGCKCCLRGASVQATR